MNYLSCELHMNGRGCNLRLMNVIHDSTWIKVFLCMKHFPASDYYLVKLLRLFGVCSRPLVVVKSESQLPCSILELGNQVNARSRVHFLNFGMPEPSIFIKAGQQPSKVNS